MGSTLGQGALVPKLSQRTPASLGRRPWLSLDFLISSVRDCTTRVEDSVCTMLEPFVVPGISGGIAVGLALTVVLSSGALIWVLQNVRFAPFSSVCEPTPGAPQSEQGTEILEDM